MKKLFIILIISMLGSTVFAQTDLSGIYNTGKQNTLIKIYEKEGVYFGEIISSDNSETVIGKELIRDLKYEDDEWEGELFSPKKEKWYDAEMELEDDNLKISISIGFFSKTIEWKRMKSEKD